jgi:peptidoglycan/xylan/chitin deacetylase (PgdA/CDA1 family)
VAGAVARGDGAVLLMHSWPRVMPEALASAISQLRDDGAEFVTIDELADRADFAASPALASE